MREMAAPMPRVPPVTRATRAIFFLPNFPCPDYRPNSRRRADIGPRRRASRNIGMKPFHALIGAAAGTHAADQLALATLPLTATLVLKAGPGTLGLLVAAQSLA